MPILYDEVEAYLREVLLQIAQHGEFSILEIGIVPTHAHLLIEKAPWANLLSIIREIQNTTSDGILIRFPELALDAKVQRVWDDGYHYKRHSEKSLDTVRQYIRNQKQHHGLV
jgi:REP element-mobilizing transposase RayT